MFVIIGVVVVIVSVFGGFVLEGGPLAVIIQPVEFMIIGGAAIGALLISAPPKLLKDIIGKIIGTVKGSTISKQSYLDLLKLMFDVFQLSRKDGLIALESHIENPETSNLFTQYPQFLNNHHILHFICDTFRLVVLGGVAAHDMEALMDCDIETHHHEGTKPGMILQKIGDSMPGLGIVAAVLGIVITMQAIDGPPEVIGHKVAVALVGTFLGIYLSYGFVQPIATNIDMANDEESKIFEVIKSGMIAFAKGLNPIIAVEFARRSIPSDYRPEFQEMEKHVKGKN
ncbi:flagellar motor stator protein MotA [Desulfobacterium sp. N47]|uniref:flagellar motor stator protein MotA n=1 Tax=Desulfobacterium sp. N47 TaxID=3115210 RepID=UPI003C8D33DB